VITGHEQRVRSDVERLYGAGVGMPDEGAVGRARRWTQGACAGEGVSAVAVGGVCIAIMLVFVGAPVTGLVVGGVPVLAWLMWRWWRPLGKACETACLPMLGGPGGDGGTGDEQADDESRGRLLRMAGHSGGPAGAGTPTSDAKHHGGITRPSSSLNGRARNYGRGRRGSRPLPCWQGGSRWPR